MAKSDRYTDKQHAEHVDRWKATGDFPENSVFDPPGHAQGGPLFRKATAEELEAAPVGEPAPEPAEAEPAGEEEGA